MTHLRCHLIGGADRSDRVSIRSAPAHITPDLACVAAVGYSVSAWIHGKKTVYRVIRRYGGLPQVKAQDDRGTWGVLLPAALSEDRTAAFHDDGSAALAGGDPATF